MISGLVCQDAHGYRPPKHIHPDHPDIYTSALALLIFRLYLFLNTQTGQNWRVSLSVMAWAFEAYPKGQCWFQREVVHFKLAAFVRFKYWNSSNSPKKLPKPNFFPSVLVNSLSLQTQCIYAGIVWCGVAWRGVHTFILVGMSAAESSLENSSRNDRAFSHNFLQLKFLPIFLCLFRLIFEIVSTCLFFKMRTLQNVVAHTKDIHLFVIDI